MANNEKKDLGMKNIKFLDTFYKGRRAYIGYLSDGPDLYKARTMCIIHNKKHEILCGYFTVKGKKEYTFPGGSIEVATRKETATPIEKLMDHIAVEECQEEVKVIVKNAEYTGVNKFYMYTGDPSKYPGKPTMIYKPNGEEDPDAIDSIKGSFSFIYVMEYDRAFSGYVAKRDQSELQKTKDWFKYSDIKDQLGPIEKDVIKKFIPEAILLGTESLTFNQFSFMRGQEFFGFGKKQEL